MRQPLTTRQAEIYQYLEEFFLKNDQIPPLLSIASEFDMGANGAKCHIKAIANRGWLEKNEVGKYRFVKVRMGPWFEQYKGRASNASD